MLIRFPLLFLVLAAGLAAQEPQPEATTTMQPREAVRQARAQLADPETDRKALFDEVATQAKSFAVRPARLDAHESIARDQARYRLLLLLAELDPTRARPLLAAAWPELSATMGRLNYMSWESQAYRGIAGALVEQLYTGGMTEPAESFVALLVTETPGNLLANLRPALQPAINHPTNKIIMAALEGAFNGENEHWNPLLNLKEGYHQGNTLRPAYLEHKLTTLPPFRKQLRRLLADTDPIGSVRIIDHEAISISITGGWTESETNPDWTGTLPPPDTTVAFRVCDFHAHLLSVHDAYPECQLYWSEAKRDKAVKALRVILEQGK